MNLESICCSLEYAKKLKGLGVEQNSLFSWVLQNPDTGKNRYQLEQNRFDDIDYAAFTASELGELLPWQMAVGKMDDNKTYACYWDAGLYGEDINFKKSIPDFTAPTIVDAMAKCLIWLKENKLI